MKLLGLLISITLAFAVMSICLLLNGCAHRPPAVTVADVKTCILDQARLYGDICAESSTGYEDMSGSDAHQAGVWCAVRSAVYCLDATHKFQCYDLPGQEEWCE